MNKEEILKEMFVELMLLPKHEIALKLLESVADASNNEKDLKSQLDIANNKLKEVEEYITLHATTTDDVNGWHTVLYDIEPLLSIIGGE